MYQRGLAEHWSNVKLHGEGGQGLSEFQDFAEECPAVYTILVRTIKCCCTFLPKVSALAF